MDNTNRYAGADWLERQLSRAKPSMAISPFGRAVADLLGELFYGLYHIDKAALYRVQWDDDDCIAISIGWKSLSTADNNDLTRLVFLAHHLAVRVTVEAATHHYLRLLFHRRGRVGESWRCHPTLDEAVARFKAKAALPEV